MSDETYQEPDWSAVEKVSIDALGGTHGSVRSWQPPGPVAFDFVNSEKFVRLLAGPYGSGKTGALVIDPVVKAARQPRCLDGVRRHKHVFVRDTYPNLYANFVPSYDEWMPRELGLWRGGENRPFRHDIRIMDEYGLIELTIEGTAIGERDPEMVLDGYQPTSVGLNGATALPPEVLEFFIGRMGRYPPKRLLPKGVDCWTGIAADFNKADADNYLYPLCEVESFKPETDYAYFNQPGGRDPGAENLDNLPDDYYDRMVRNWPAHKVKRLVDNKWGAVRTGQPVYNDEWDDAKHAPRETVAALPGLKIGIGFDGGSTLSPAAVFGQRDTEGQWRILAEVVGAKGTGATRFARQVLDFAAEAFPGFEFYGFADPSAFGGKDSEGGESTWAETLENILGFVIEPAPTNQLQTRLDAVKVALEKDIGGRPGLVLASARCPMLKKGFDSGYQFVLQKVAGKEVPASLPGKTGEAGKYSHPHDALQYLILGTLGLDVVTALSGRGLQGAGDDQEVPQSDWSPFD